MLAGNNEKVIAGIDFYFETKYKLSYINFAEIEYFSCYGSSYSI